MRKITTVYLLSISGTHSPFVNIARHRDSKTNIMDAFNFKIVLCVLCEVSPALWFEISKWVNRYIIMVRKPAVFAQNNSIF